MSELQQKKKARTIKLLCPALSKAAALVVRDEQWVDLGSIARAFGLDPWTVRLNGHFISRGLDLVSTSVTWRSLLSFFSSKGLPTGVEEDVDRRPLIVDGKLLKVGSKRGYEPREIMNGSEEEDCSGENGRQSKDVRTSNVTKRLKSNDHSGHEHARVGFSSDGGGLKRKHLLDNVNLLKRLKISDTAAEFGNKEGEVSRIIPKAEFTCRYIGEDRKRMHDGGTLYTPCKRIR